MLINYGAILPLRLTRKLSYGMQQFVDWWREWQQYADAASETFGENQRCRGTFAHRQWQINRCLAVSNGFIKGCTAGE